MIELSDVATVQGVYMFKEGSSQPWAKWYHNTLSSKSPFVAEEERGGRPRAEKLEVG